MASDKTWPTVQPLPKFIIQLGLAAFFVLGKMLLWNDRRVAGAGNTKADINVEKPMGLPAYK